MALSASAGGRARFPMSLTHCLELRKIQDPNRRQQLANFFITLSGGWFLAAWRLVLPAECWNAVISFYGLDERSVRIEPIGRGMIFATGAYDWAQREMRWSFDFAQAVDRVRDTPEDLLSILLFQNPDASPPLHDRLASIAARFASRNEVDREERRRMPLQERRALRAAEIFLSIQHHVIRAHAQRGRDAADLLSTGREGVLDFIARMPSVHVDLELGLQWEKQWSRRVQPNDLDDFGHLNVAIPYCDAVLTEKFWTELAGRAGLTDRYGTIVAAETDALLDIVSR